MVIKMEHNNRIISIDLLKILCALMVLTYHTVNTLVPLSSITLAEQFCVLFCGWGGGRVAVDVFVIISSWFLCDKVFNFERIIYIWLCTVIYSIIVGVIFYYRDGLFLFFIKHFFPISFDLIWFIRCYLIMVLISPLLNILLRYKITKQFVVTFFVIFSLYKSIFPKNAITLDDYGVFLFIYLITGVLKNHYNCKNNILFFFTFLMCYVFNIIWFLFFDIFSDRLTLLISLGFNKNIFNQNLDSIVCLLCSFSLFFVFLHLKISPIFAPVIKWLSSSCLGVYVFLSLNSPNNILWWCDCYYLTNWLSDFSFAKLYSLIILLFLCTVSFDHFVKKLVILIIKSKYVKNGIFSLNKFFLLD